MDPTPAPPTAPTGHRYTAPTRGIAVASVSLGFFSLVVFWWFPFSLMLASVGFTLGLISLIVGLRGGLRGENMALIGTLLCGTSLGVVVTLTNVIRYLQWDSLKDSVFFSNWF
jgi:hypothetical protein